MTQASKINLKTDLVAAIENFRQKSKSYREADEKYNELKKNPKLSEKTSRNN